MTVAKEDSPAESARHGAATREIVHLVPHTHWDREWYLPWQRFRMRLVELVDALLDEMAVDDRVRFTLDGQTATVDDYLEIRPEREAALAALVADGRLAVGPWRILMDEFLVSGETQVRNLEMGVRRATELGRVMEIGYLPDMFGHVAQMPQMLARAGIRDAVVWRGVPAAIDQHVFWWRAPDGSAVRAEYLLGGYGNGRDILALADRIGPKLDVFVAEQRQAFGAGELLALYGEDHSIPRPGYADLVAGFNASQDRYEIRIETLADAIAATRDGPAPERSWDGELRSSARANVLMGVTSHRIEVKQAAGRVERLIERAVEPLWSLHGRSWPGALLEEAWRRVVENSAHDSICACSAEATVAQVLVRYGEAEQIATGLLDRLLLELGSGVGRGSHVVANPSPFDRAAVVALDVALPVVGEAGPVSVRDAQGAAVPVQPDGVTRLVVRESAMAGSDVVPYLRRRLHARELFGYQVNGYRTAEPDDDGARRLTIDVDRTPDPEELDVDELLDALAAETALAPDARWRLSVVARPRLRLLVQPTVPALAWATVAAAVGPDDGRATPWKPVVAIDRGLSNGLVSVTVGADGTLEMAADDVVLTGVGRIVDGGDVGDSYNYAPPPHDTVVERPGSVGVVSGRSGPLVGDLTVHRTYAWPAGLLDDVSARTEATVATPVDMTVELRAGEPFVRIAVAIENRSVDHRVRFHVPITGGADRSRAEGQFAIVERGLETEGGHGELPLPTFPAYGFIVAGTVCALLEHVTEYELVGGSGGSAATELALTLIRATGLISRDDHPYRDEPAGPVIAAPTGQAQGRRTVAFAILPLASGSRDPVILRAADAFRHPFLVGPGSGPSDVTVAGGRGLRIDGDGVVLASLRSRAVETGLVRELRLVREAAGDGIAVVSGTFDRARDVDLLGRPLGDWRSAGGRLELGLGGWEIRTVQLAAGPASEA